MKTLLKQLLALGAFLLIGQISFAQKIGNYSYNYASSGDIQTMKMSEFFQLNTSIYYKVFSNGNSGATFPESRVSISMPNREPLVFQVTSCEYGETNGGKYVILKLLTTNDPDAQIHIYDNSATLVTGGIMLMFASK